MTKSAASGRGRTQAKGSGSTIPYSLCWCRPSSRSNCARRPSGVFPVGCCRPCWTCMRTGSVSSRKGEEACRIKSWPDCQGAAGRILYGGFHVPPAGLAFAEGHGFPHAGGKSNTEIPHPHRILQTVSNGPVRPVSVGTAAAVRAGPIGTCRQRQRQSEGQCLTCITP